MVVTQPRLDLDAATRITLSRRPQTYSDWGTARFPAAATITAFLLAA